MRSSFWTTLVVVLLCVSSIGLAQSPNSLSFQGVLADTTGVPVADGNYDLLTKMYKGSTKVWEQNHAGVPVSGGVFNIILSSTPTYPLDTVSFNSPIDLGIAVNGGNEMTPRTPLTSAPFARAMPGLYTVLAIDGSSIAYNVVGGGSNNVVGTGVVGATIGGGGGRLRGVQQRDSVLGHFGTIGGGGNNTIGGGGVSRDFSEFATIAGGHFNIARGDNATVGGGTRNTASAPGATVPGGQRNTASGVQTFAAGFKAEAKHSGAWVWSDASDTDSGMVSTGQNQFLIRAAGGVGIGTNAPGSPLTVNGRIESESGGFKFPDGTIQTTATGTDSWSLGGNTGTTPGSDYLGTSDGAALEIRSTGGVGINTPTPLSDSELHVEHGSMGADNWGVVVTNSTNSDFRMGMRISNSGFFEITNNADNAGPNFAQLNSTGNWTAVSDRRLKTDIEPASDLLDAALELEPVRYHFKNLDDQGQKTLGVIGQQVKDVVPSLVTEGELVTVNYAGLSVVAIGAIQSLYAIVKEQQEIIEVQNARLARLEAAADRR